MMRAIGALGLAALVAGCEGLPELPSLGFAGLGGVVTRDIVLRDGFRVVAPDGYCIDTASQQADTDRVFVALASCINLGAVEGAGPSVPALLTASVGPLPTDGFDRDTRDGLAMKFAASPPGALARSGSVRDVTVHDVQVSRAALYVELSDASLEGVAPRYWRGFLPVADRLVVLAAQSPSDMPMGSFEGEALIRSFAALLLEANELPEPPGVMAFLPMSQAEASAAKYVTRVFEHRQ